MSAAVGTARTGRRVRSTSGGCAEQPQDHSRPALYSRRRPKASAPWLPLPRPASRQLPRTGESRVAGYQPAKPAHRQGIPSQQGRYLKGAAVHQVKTEWNFAQKCDMEKKCCSTHGARFEAAFAEVVCCRPGVASTSDWSSATAVAAVDNQRLHCIVGGSAVGPARKVNLDRESR